MSEDCLKLTTYFGERDRTPRGLLADELLDLYHAHRVRTSVLLRGAEGFGRLHHLHTDRLLTLSEDLPLVSVAVDRRERIEELLADVLAIKPRGLITLERAQLLTGRLDPVQLPTSKEPEQLPTGKEPVQLPTGEDPVQLPTGKEPEQLPTGEDPVQLPTGRESEQLPTGEESVRLPEQLHEATKLTVYVGRQERVRGRGAFLAVCELLHARGLAGATVLLGVDGTRNGHRARAAFFSRNARVPTMIIAVGSRAQIAGVLPELRDLLREPLMTLERVRVCKRDGELLATPHELPRTDRSGRPLWQKLMLYTSQSATHEGHPINLQVIRRLRESDAAGATSVRGVWGFHGDHPPHGDRLLQIRRHVPVLTIAIDTPQRIARSFQIIHELTPAHGLLTSEMVPALSAIGADAGTQDLGLAEHEF